MATILVTGGGGYIGSVLVPALLEAGHAVRVVDRFFFGRQKLPDHPHLTLVQEDTRFLAPGHMEGVDQVIDMAALSNDPSGEAFQEATRAINHHARARTARLARDAGARRYLLVSSCSVYGFHDPDRVVDETSEPAPLTTYAKANLAAEQEILPLADDRFTALAVRLATVFGLSPRMRFDLAVNGMTFGAWARGRLPLLRDGTQWRPMVHVADVAAALLHLLALPAGKVRGEVFNVGHNDLNVQLRPLAEAVAVNVPGPVEIDWYGEPDHRSYRVRFDKLAATGWRPQRTVADGVLEIVAALDAGSVDRDTESLTLNWYQELVRWHEIIQAVTLRGGIIDLPDPKEKQP